MKKLEIIFNHLEDSEPVEIKLEKTEGDSPFAIPDTLTLNISEFLDLEREVNMQVFYKEDVKLALEARKAPKEAKENEDYISFLTYRYYNRRQEAQESWSEALDVIISEYPYEEWKEGE